ncbi:MAG: nicotinamide-nucleotide adenylyltransferase [Candidatus Thorarchaeota archaeon]
MDNENLACIDDKNIKYLQSGQINKYLFPTERKIAHEKKITHLITRIFILSVSANADIKYLVQKRSIKKDSYPGYFTDSASGHVIWKKNMDLLYIKKSALRELNEEFGIPPKSVQKIRFYELYDEEDDQTREIAYVFLGLVDFEVDLKPDPDELNIEKSRFYTKTELEDIIKNEKSVDHSREIWKILLETEIKLLFGEESKSIQADHRNIALFIGRFQPLHHGHIYVLNNILKSYKTVKIGIGSSQLSNTLQDPFTNIERQEFIKTAFNKRQISVKKYKIYDIPDIFDAKRWVNHVQSIVGEFDIIYSNSDWIRELFQKKGIRVGKKISIFKRKYNGSNIRNLIIKGNDSWKPLVPKEVVELIDQFKGIDRLISLHEVDNK